MNKTCEHCGAEFITTNYRAKYCSSRCRLKRWQVLHPDKWNSHQLKYRDKIPKLCKGCGSELSRRRGNVYCNVCAKQSHTESTKRYKVKNRDLFHSIKKQFGCIVCGWNAYGAALDFHHVTSDKACQITATNWTTTKALNEYHKCILVCKNCHYGIHHKCVSDDAIPTNVPDYRYAVEQAINTEEQ